MSKHTLGPWTMQTVRTSSGVCFKVGPFPWKHGKLNHACIYADYPTPGGPEYVVAVANAVLIAAAPDLLEALKKLLAGCEYRSIGGDEPRWHVKSMPTDSQLEWARLAIEKATGGS